MHMISLYFRSAQILEELARESLHRFCGEKERANSVQIPF